MMMIKAESDPSTAATATTATTAAAKKGKGTLSVSLSLPAGEFSDDVVRGDPSSFSTSRPPPPARNASSKYDFVKVKVWLGDNADHYYVLSRFLLSRMLTVTKIPNHVAIKIALELKKLLIDNSLLDVKEEPNSIRFASALVVREALASVPSYVLTKGLICQCERQSREGAWCWE